MPGDRNPGLRDLVLLTIYTFWGSLGAITFAAGTAQGNQSGHCLAVASRAT